LDPVRFDVVFPGTDICAFVTRPLFAIRVVFRAANGVVVRVAMFVPRESRLANGAFEGSRVAVCLLMRSQIAGVRTFEAAPFPISGDVLTHEVEDPVVVEVRVISQVTALVERFATPFVRTLVLFLRVRAVCHLMPRQTTEQ
jgi:hypothetical protein